MKKKIVFIIATLLLTIIGGIYMYQEQKKQEMLTIATSEAAIKFYEERMIANDPKAFTDKGIIKTYKIDEKSLKYNPMGGLLVKIYINGDEKLDFHFGVVINENGEYETYGYTLSPELSKILKERGITND